MWARAEARVDVQVSVNLNVNQINYIQLIYQTKLEQKIQLNVNSYGSFSVKGEFLEFHYRMAHLGLVTKLWEINHLSLFFP